MALAYFDSETQSPKRVLGLAYAWSGFAVMWGFWVCFVIFLADPPWAAKRWPLPTVDTGGSVDHYGLAAFLDLGLIGLFGLQHSMMARPWFKERILRRLPPAFERSTFVHAANVALLALVIGWQPIPVEIWNLGPAQTALEDGIAVPMAPTPNVCRCAAGDVGYAANDRRPSAAGHRHDPLCADRHAL